MPSLHPTEFYFFPHFVSRISPIVPPEIVSPSTGLPRKMILVSSLYPFGPKRFQALHGASIRYSLKVLAVQVKVCFGASSAKQGTVAPSNNTHAVNTVECRAITASHKVHSFQKITNVGIGKATLCPRRVDGAPLAITHAGRGRAMVPS